MDKINLRSNLFIKLIGKDEITLEEFQAVDDFLLDGAGIDFSSSEVENIKHDLEYVFNEAKDNQIEISFVNCPDNIRDYILKHAPTYEIYFDGHEEFISKLERRKVKVSEEFKKYIGDDTDLTEYEVYKYVKSEKFLELPFIISVEDIELVRKYANFQDFKIKVRNAEEYERVALMADEGKKTIIIDNALAKQIERKEVQSLPNVNLCLELESVLDASSESINYLKENSGLSEVLISYGQEDMDGYSLEDFYKIRARIEEILSNVDPSLPEIDRFMKIYQALGREITYEFDENGEPSFRMEAHNLIGGLLEHTCVCEGYAKILYQTLKCTNIENIYISGITTDIDSRHAWNQVKIDGIWYNCDLTWDSYEIQDRRALEYCLQSDKEFIFHTPESKGVKRCDVSYDKNKIYSLLDYSLPLEFDEKAYSEDEVISLFNSIKEFGHEGIRVAINTDYCSGRSHLSIGNIIDDDTVMWSDNKVFINSIQDFIEKYIASYSTDSVNKQGVVNFIRSASGVELVLCDDLKEELALSGVNLEPLFTVVKPADDKKKLLATIRGMDDREYQAACSEAESEWNSRKNKDKGLSVERVSSIDR